MFSILGMMGAMAALGGTVGFFVFPTGLSMGIKMFINLSENGMVFPKYINPPVGPVSTYYLFAIKNPSEVLQGKKAKFDLKGPFVFNTVLTREEVKFTNDGEKVSFDSSRQLVWNLDKSANVDEKMWIINPIMPNVAKIVKTLILDRVPFKRLSEPVVFNAVNLLLDNYKERLIMRTTPRRLFDGRKIQLLESLSGLANRFGAGFLVPPGPPQNVFGVVYVQNRTIETVELWTGTGKTVNKYGEVSKFKGKERLDVWRGKCNTITGTNGELHKPFVQPGKPLRVFIANLCRSFDLDPVGDGQPVPTASGLMGLEFELTDRMFQGARSQPANKCFCVDPRTYDCQFDGLFPMGPCYFDAPLFFARVNFRGADPRISELVDWQSATTLNGSQPDWRLPEKQSFKIEPITGTVLEADITIMATFKIVRQPYMRDLANVQNLTYMPMFVTNDRLKLPFSAVWQVYYLQIFNNYHKPIMAGTALSGLGVMVFKFFFG